MKNQIKILCQSFDAELYHTSQKEQLLRLDAVYSALGKGINPYRSYHV